MQHNSNWQCDGIPKNGSTYDGLGFEHELKENFGDSCNICGLPREAMLGEKKKNQKMQLLTTNDPKQRKANWKYVLIFLMGSAIIGGSVIAMNPCWVERFFIKCPTDQDNRNYKNQYDGINKQAENAIKNFLQPNDIKFMKASREEINVVIGKLEGIKNNTKNAKCCPPLAVSLVIEQDLPKLKANLVDMDMLIAVENLAIDANKLASTAQSITDLEVAKTRFDGILIDISKITDKSALIQKANAKKEEYNKKLLALDEKIKKVKEAQKQLDEAKILGDRAIDKGRLAINTNELKYVEKMLIDSIAKLDNIPRDTINETEISSKLRDYESALSKVRNASKKVSCETALFGNCVRLPLSLP